MKKVLSSFLCIMIIFAFSACTNSGFEDLTEQKTTFVQNNKFYNYIANQKNDCNFTLLTPKSYKVTKKNEIFELANDAKGLLSAYITKIDKNDAMLCVNINENTEDGVNVGGLEINLISNDENFSKSSYKSIEPIIRNDNFISHSIYYCNKYIAIYHHYGSNFGGGSVYGFVLEIAKISNFKIKTYNNFTYSYYPNHCYLKDTFNNKTYYSGVDSANEKFSYAFESMKEDMPDCFSELISFNQSDFKINNVKNASILSEIKMGKTDYSTYYYQDFVDKTNLSEKLNGVD